MLPPRPVLLRETDQVVDRQYLSIIQHRRTLVPSEHLVDFTEDDAQIGASGAIFEEPKR